MSGATLFSAIEELQGETPFGRVLDAGTGLRSLRWIIGLETDSWTAVTGTRGMAARAKRVIGEQMRPRDRLEVGNWADPEFLAGQEYDTVLADHLLGAIEGFAPFFQTSLFPRLRAILGGLMPDRVMDEEAIKGMGAMMGAHAESMETMQSLLIERHGSVLEPVRRAGLSDATIAQLRERLVVPAS